MTSFKKAKDVEGKKLEQLSAHQIKHYGPSPSPPPGCQYEFKCLFLSMPRVQLFQRIDARCEAIIEQGLFTVSWWLLEELTQCLESV